MIVYPNAKINLGLNVVERRVDGYHNLESVFFPVAIRDMLEIVELPEGEGDYEWHCDGMAIDCDLESNICIKAYRLLQKEYKLPRVGIYLYKNIPMGAGMGGGSSDGAFVLKALNDMFGLGMSKVELISKAAQIGADCAFFIENKPSYVTGIGDKLEHFDIDLSGYYLVVCKPDVHISTAEAYRGITPKPSKENVRDILRRPINEWKDLLVNDFEESIFKNHPEIKATKDMMYECGAIYSSMSGSGSAVYGIFDKEITLEGGITLKL